jgi:hypothetical protein
LVSLWFVLLGFRGGHGVRRHLGAGDEESRRSAAGRVRVDIDMANVCCNDSDELKWWFAW